MYKKRSKQMKKFLKNKLHKKNKQRFKLEEKFQLEYNLNNKMFKLKIPQFKMEMIIIYI